MPGSRSTPWTSNTCARCGLKFANITSSPNEIVVNATFHLEVGNLSSDFNIVIPYLMIEPMRQLLNGPLTDTNPDEEPHRNKRMAGEIAHSEIELITDFRRTGRPHGRSWRSR
jgi:flagellar motor switch protein FliM